MAVNHFYPPPPPLHGQDPKHIRAGDISIKHIPHAVSKPKLIQTPSLLPFNLRYLLPLRFFSLYEREKDTNTQSRQKDGHAQTQTKTKTERDIDRERNGDRQIERSSRFPTKLHKPNYGPSSTPFCPKMGNQISF